MNQGNGFFNRLFDFVKRGLIFRSHLYLDPLLIPLYRRSIPGKVERMRGKSVVKVAFVVPELGVWKTESLYLKMKEHSRFEPVILVIPSTEVPESADAVVRYAEDKGYSYVDMRNTDKSIGKAVHPDIIFYQKPYDYSLANKYNFRQNHNALFCFASYGFRSVNIREVQETPLTNACWQLYFENDITLDAVESIKRYHCGNGCVTGIPMMDDLLQPKETYDNPWKKIDDGKRRKRIIWAPHHSVGNGDHKGIDYSTFLSFADFMLDMAERYSDKIQLAFKPHPLLKGNLRECWDEKRIDDYYSRWEQLENGQLELGGYKGLFMHSDAMIHDCSSFTIEYLYTGNPVMYLVKNADHDANQNAFASAAYNLHQHGNKESDVTEFVENVIAGKNPREAEQKDFYRKSLLPPNGNTACENIINAILGVD